MSLMAWGQALVGLVYTVFFLRLVQQRNRRPHTQFPYRVVALTVLSTAMWGWFALAHILVGPTVGGLQLASVIMDTLRYGGWFAFLLVLLRSDQPKAATTRVSWLMVCAGLLVIVGVVVPVWNQIELNLNGESTRLSLLARMSSSIFALVLLEQVFRNATEDSRWNIKPLCLGLAGVFLFDLYVYSQAVMFGRVDASALQIRGGVHAIVAPLLALSMSRRSDWISKIRISPKAAFHSASLFIAGIYLVFMSAVGYYVRFFGGEWGQALQVGLVFFAILSLLVLAVSGSVRANLRVFLGKHFFRYRYDYREEWLKFTRTLFSRNTPQEVGQQVIRGLADMLESPGGGLWVRANGDAAFSQTARWNMPQTLDREMADSPLCEFMVTSGWVINLEEFRSYSRRYGDLRLPKWLQETEQAWLVVPLMVGSELIGFVVLASARTSVEVNWEVNDLLKTAGQQAASFLAQMQATEALLEVRKFDSFNRMSAFVVHDLKNIVTQLSLMMKNAKRLSGNPEFQQDMLITVENSLDRMRQLMLQLREGATPPGAAFGVDLNQIAERIRLMSAGRGRALELHVGEPVLARGHEERLERIVGHMVQNALDATQENGRVSLTVDRVVGQARIVVSDTGHGMSKDFIRDRLFKPFQTTKQAGMGIGAYESFQYVQELGGKIEVKSDEGEGTTMTILLPVFEVRAGSDLH